MNGNFDSFDDSISRYTVCFDCFNSLHGFDCFDSCDLSHFLTIVVVLWVVIKTEKGRGLGIV